MLALGVCVLVQNTDVQELPKVPPVASGGAASAAPGPTSARGEGAREGSTPKARAEVAEPAVRVGMAQAPCPASEWGRLAPTEGRTAKLDRVQEVGAVGDRGIVWIPLPPSPGVNITQA